MIAKAETNIVLIVENAHTASCGNPPALRHCATDDRYTGFFANRYGEQWIVVIDPNAKTGVLRGGDIGWDTEVQIADGKIVSDVVLGDDERCWLDACWRAACGQPLV